MLTHSVCLANDCFRFQQIKAALDLMRRLPPKDIESSLTDVLTLAPDIVDDLLSSVDQPLKVARCPESGKDYLLCDYNRDGDSYRRVGNLNQNVLIRTRNAHLLTCESKQVSMVKQV